MFDLHEVQLTQRDVAIIQFINELGFCEMPQIERRFVIKRPLSYRIMRRLIRAQLVIHSRVFHSAFGIYHVTAKGASFTGLPPMGKISVGRYEHQCRVNDVCIKLKQQYPDTSWISERRLKHDKYYEGVGKRGHLPDGVLLFQDGREIAIEVELNLKGKKRIQQIFKGYAAQFSLDEVWYFCPQGMVAALEGFAVNLPFIKVHSLEAYLYDESV